LHFGIVWMGENDHRPLKIQIFHNPPSQNDKFLTAERAENAEKI
jgi:hypothetical protein